MTLPKWVSEKWTMRIHDKRGERKKKKEKKKKRIHDNNNNNNNDNNKPQSDRVTE